MKTRTPAISLIFTLAFIGTAHAQAPAEKSKPADATKIDFATVDKDANGRLTKQEALVVAELEAVFSTLDTDRDGTVSSAEFSHWIGAGKASAAPRDPATAPGGSAGAQHMPAPP